MLFPRKSALEQDAQIIDNSLREASEGLISKKAINDGKKQLEQFGDQLRSAKASVASLLTKVQAQELEIEDSLLFIDELKQRLEALDESLVSREALGGLALTHCPQCLSQLQGTNDGASCPLCRQSLASSPTH